jgi:hypothetical protein
MKRLLPLFLSLAAVSTGATVTPRYYVSDSLVAMYDAVCNATNAAGAFVHDGAATKWIDLSGNGRDFTVTANGSWTDTTFEFNGASATLSPGLPYYRTQEVRLEMDSGRWPFCGSSQGNQVYQGLVTAYIGGTLRLNQFEVAWNGNRDAQMRYLNASGASSSPYTTSVTYGKPGKGSVDCFVNGAATTPVSKANGWDSDGRSLSGDRPAGG